MRTLFRRYSTFVTSVAPIAHEGDGGTRHASVSYEQTAYVTHHRGLSRHPGVNIPVCRSVGYFPQQTAVYIHVREGLDVAVAVHMATYRICM